MSVSRKVRFLVLRRDHFTCRYCGRTADQGALEVDHVVPTASGGTSDPSNLVTACVLCNQGKGALALDDVDHAIELAYYVFEARWADLFGGPPPKTWLRSYWNRSIAPHLRGSLQRHPCDAPAVFCRAIAETEVVEGTRAYRRGDAPSPMSAMLAFHALKRGA